MKEIQIANIIVKKRKEKKLTQEDLAKYMGVSKAAISKWETGQSYPDLTLLPILAAYFNLTIDELMGYVPQMTQGEIKILYKRLCSQFVSQTFEDVISECEVEIKKYYSCFPLLHQIGLLYINHSMLAPTPEEMNRLNQEAKCLFQRVKMNTTDVELAKQALQLESYCYLLLNEPEKVLELLGEMRAPKVNPDVLKSTAYQMLGRMDEAKIEVQIGFFQHLMEMFQSYTMLLTFSYGDKPKFEALVSSVMGLVQLFEIKKLNPSMVLPQFLLIAQGYALFGEVNQALDYLDEYVQLASKDLFPITIKGNHFFDSIDSWLEEYDIGVAPRNERLIKQSLIDGLTQNPAFESLKQEKRFNQLINKLKHQL